MGLLEELNQDGRTIVMVTHDYEIAKQAKEIIVLEDGSIVDKNGTSPIMNDKSNLS